MQLEELTAYAREKYQIGEQHKWADFPGFSVLCHPQTGKWVALLMRQWDTQTGEEIQRCDLKCGRDSKERVRRPYLAPPVRMQGRDWVGVAFDRRTEREVVCWLFDQAVRAGMPQGATIVLEPRPGRSTGKYRDTALPFAGQGVRTEKEILPEKLREMKHLFEYGRESDGSRARNFFRQAAFMKDYEDDVPWSGSFVCYFPTYQDLTTRQLRGYFTWRAGVRRGEFRPIATSAAYIYVYELLNGVGAADPADSLRKMKEFEAGYLDSGIGDQRMRANLRRWMLEYAVLHDLPREYALQAADPEEIRRDEALSVLRGPKEHTDEEVFGALCVFGGKKLEGTPVVTKDPERGRRLFCDVWRAASEAVPGKKDLFTLCFGEKTVRPWHPLSNAVYYDRSRREDRDYALDGCRVYRRRNGAWQSETFEKLSFDKARFQSFVHGTDARLRRYLKTGRYLREDPADEWCLPFIESVTEADRQALIEASKPKITIDLSGLEQIRRDAGATRDSLLTEEEREEFEGSAGTADDLSGKVETLEDLFPEIEAAPEQPAADGPEAEDSRPDLPLDEVQLRVIRALLEDEDVSGIIRDSHRMPSVLADSINEALFDGIGDTVLLCEGDRLILVDDYIDELKQHLGGTANG